MQHFFNLSKNEISCWLWSLGILCLCFFPLIFHFIWGNHDWLPILNDAGLNAGLVEGRFSQYLLLNIFLAGKILPILNIILGFALYSLALILLCSHFFNFQLTTLTDKLFIITVVTLPYINEIIYFRFITFSLLGWVFIITLSLCLAKQATKKNYILNTLASAFLLFIAAGGYPASVTMYAVAACLYTINHPNFKKLCPFIISFIIALAPLPFIYKWLKTQNLMISLYNSETETIPNLIRKIPDTILTSLQSLYQPQPFFPLDFKILTVLIFALFCVQTCKTYYKTHRFYLYLFLIPSLFLILKLPLWLSQQTAENYYTKHDPAGFMVRGDFYAIPLLLLFSLFYLKKHTSQWGRNLLFAASAILLWFNINLNLSFCKTMLLGFKAENMLFQRIVSRIQQHPNYTPNNTYSIIQTGEIYFRPKYYTPTLNENYGYYTLKVPFTRYWLGAEHYNFYAPQNFAENQSPLTPEGITPQLMKFISNQSAIWPAPNSIYLDNKFCIIALTPDGKQPFTEQFNHIKRQRQ